MAGQAFTHLTLGRSLVRLASAGAHAGEDGLAVGELQELLEIPASTLSHHLAHLVNAGLVRQSREGRVLRCTPNFALMNLLLGFLTEQCCAGVGVPKPRQDAG